MDKYSGAHDSEISCDIQQIYLINKGGFPWKVLLKFWYCRYIRAVEKWELFIVHLQEEDGGINILSSSFFYFSSFVNSQRLIFILFHPKRFIWTINACFEQTELKEIFLKEIRIMCDNAGVERSQSSWILSQKGNAGRIYVSQSHTGTD